MIPAAALTAFAREEDRAAALSAGYQMHLTKPIDAGTLVAAVAMLGRSSSYAAARTGS
jgi:CheY-like chemotaxis protein